MGLLNGAYAPGGGMPMRPGMMPPQMPQMGQQPQGPQMPPQQGGGGLMAAFANNPQFQQQLMQMMQQQGPGNQPVQFTPPQTQVQNAPAGAGADLWHDGINGNARAAGLAKPGGRGGFNLGNALLGGGVLGFGG